MFWVAMLTTINHHPQNPSVASISWLEPLVVKVVLVFVVMMLPSCRGYNVYEEIAESEVAIREISDCGLVTTEQLNEILDEHSSHPAYILDQEKNVEFFMDADDSDVPVVRRTIMYYSYVVIDPNDDDYSVFEVETLHGQEDVVSLDIQVCSRKSVADRYSIGDIVWAGSTGKLALQRIDVGSIVTIAMELQTAGSIELLHQAHDLDRSVPYEHLEVNLYYPSMLIIKFKNGEDYEAPQHETESIEGQEVTKYTFVREHGDPIADEAFSPYSSNMVERVQASVYGVRSRVGTPRPFLKNGYSDILQGIAGYEADRFGKRFLRRFTDDLLDSHETLGSDQKIEIILAFVQDNLEVDNSIDRPTYSDLIDIGKGDVWTITDLTYFMLNHAGVETGFAFLHDARYGVFDTEFPDGSMQTPGVYFEYKGHDVFCLPYMTTMPLGLVVPQYIGESAFVVHSNGVSNSFHTVKQYEEIPNRRDHLFDVVVSDGGDVHVTETLISSGLYAYWLRERLLEAKAEQTYEDLVLEVLDYAGTFEGLQSVNIQHETVADSNLTLAVTYTLNGAATMLPDEVLLRLEDVAPSLFESAYDNIDAVRENPISIRYKRSQAIRMNIQFPASWVLDSQQYDMHTENALGSTTFKSAESKGRFSVATEFSLVSGEWEASKGGELARILQRDDTKNMRTLIFEK